MPFTPLVLRPMGRASDSAKRIAMPWAVASTTSSPGLVDDHVDDLVVFACSLMAIMPPRFGRL